MNRSNIHIEYGDIFERTDARWIGCANVNGIEEAPAPELRKTIEIEKEIKYATIYISGLGQYEGYINDIAFDERIVFAPTVSDYSKTVYFNKYSIKDNLKSGENVISVVLGRGRYAFNTAGTPWNGEKAVWVDAVKMIAVVEIVYTDDTQDIIVSDDTWQFRNSGIIQDCMYMGETFDARVLESGINNPWRQCVCVAPPKGRLVYDFSEPIVISKRISPKYVNKLSDGVFVAGFENYMTGWIELEIDCSKDTKVSIQYAEICAEDGSVVLNHCITPNGRLQKDEFISSGNKYLYRPKFSYKGFRYVQIEGISSLDISQVVGCEVHNDIKMTSSLSCSNDLVTWVHDVFCRTAICNFHGLPTDTPVFEKHGWTADAATVLPSVLFNYDAHKFFRKWLNDFKDNQDTNGKIPVIVPTTGWGFDDTCTWKDICGPVPAWDVCYPELVYYMYWCYEDKDAVEIYYDSLQKYVEYLSEYSDGGICKVGLGDWLAPTGNLSKNSAESPEGPGITEGLFHIKIIYYMEKIAQFMGKADEACQYAKERESLIKIYNDTYYNSERGYYCSSQCEDFRQAPNALALVFDIASPEQKVRILDNLTEDLKNRNYHLGTGIMTSHYLLIALSEAGLHNVAFKVFSQEGYPGWDFIRKQGDTTLCECWEYERSRSHCHYATGAVDEWIIRYIVGIEQLAPGFKKVRITPNIPSGIDHISFGLETVSGKISIDCRRVNGKVCSDIFADDGIEIVR